MAKNSRPPGRTPAVGQSRQRQQQQQQQQQHNHGGAPRQSQGPNRQRQQQQSHRRSKAKRGHVKEQTLVFDQNERIDFVKGFGKRKQERRERAKQEALVKEREIRKLLRQKRKEALERLGQTRLGPESGPKPEIEESAQLGPATATVEAAGEKAKAEAEWAM